MSDRPPTLVTAAVLLVVIGISGLFAAAGLFAVVPRAGELGSNVVGAGIGVGLVIGAYALAATIAGVGLAARRVWAWWIGVVTIAVGLGLLGVSIALAGTLDAVLSFGVAVWGVTLAGVLAPATRHNVRR